MPDRPPAAITSRKHQVVYFEKEDKFVTLYTEKYGAETSETSKPSIGVTGVQKPHFATYTDTQQTAIQARGPVVYRSAFYVGPAQGAPEGWQHGVGLQLPDKPELNLDLPPLPTQEDIFGYDENGYPIYTVSEAALNSEFQRAPNMLFPAFFDLMMPPIEADYPVMSGNQVGVNAWFKYTTLKKLHPDWSQSQIFTEMQKIMYTKAEKPPGYTPMNEPYQWQSGSGTILEPGDEY